MFPPVSGNDSDALLIKLERTRFISIGSMQANTKEAASVISVFNDIGFSSNENLFSDNIASIIGSINKTCNCKESATFVSSLFL